MSLPGLIMLILFRYLPMYGIIIAFQRYGLFLGITKSPWIGFENFVRFFQDPYCFRLIRNTFLLGIYSILWTFPAPILLAVLFNEVKSNRFKRITQSISYMPYFISTVIIVCLMKSLLSSDDGILNKCIIALGGSNIAFFNEPKWFRTLYIGSDIWQGIGYGSIIFLAAITGIDAELYEASRIDGANRLHNIIHITLPSILPTIAVLFVLRMGAVLSVGFEKVFLMYSPATYETSDVLSTYVYRIGLLGQDFGYGTAVNLFNSIVSVIILLLANLFSKKVLQESLW
jgi:putative aldouronate transport system permease protein